MRNRRLYNLLILFLSIITGFGTLWFTQVLVERLKTEEHQKVLNIAGATRLLSNTTVSFDNNYSFIIDIIQNNESIPLIVLDENDNIINSRNIDDKSPKILEVALEEMKQHYPPIEIQLVGNKKNIIYYDDSIWLKRLRFFPYVQILLVGLLFIAFWWFYRRQNAMDKHLLWVGLAKETAHQLGTPISALQAWLDLLELEDGAESISKEMRRDVMHLSAIAERFSMIGSVPSMEDYSLVKLVEDRIAYFKPRAPKKVRFIHSNDEELVFPMNKILLGWVFENLIKNALDSIEGSGEIVFSYGKEKDQVYIEIKDSGKGIPLTMQKKIFNTGFSTKPRGWGLGLSLARRIVEEYHGGRIRLIKSVESQGSVFRVTLRAKSTTGN
ncbi:HAMP domain-containing histidine kinase [Halosquirtibacter xylanolyticus]|uniref:sensor histidine kinase n=1 Tax=Halosquirtibacter xylanolyticus TaxID=3374599 RepID=UPI0037482C86|nr:HAMP domain-containing histidine kinase [Prolixibacteraceae bacterium]